MAKRRSTNKSQAYKSIVQIMGFMLTCGVIFYILVSYEDTSPIVFGVIAMVGFIGSAMLPTILTTIKQVIQENYLTGKSRTSTQSSLHKKSDKPQKPVQQFIPHVLNEPVPDTPSETVYSLGKIRELAPHMNRWTERAEQITIQLLQEFTPEDRPRARIRLHDLKRLREPRMVIAALVYAEGDLEKLGVIVDFGNMDYRELLSVF